MSEFANGFGFLVADDFSVFSMEEVSSVHAVDIDGFDEELDREEERYWKRLSKSMNRK